MSLLLIGNESATTAYPLTSIKNVKLRKQENDGVHSVQVKAYIEGPYGDKVLYDEQGDESVIEDAEKLYRKVLDGMVNGKTVNLSEFSLTAPKKAPAKKSEPEPETPTEQPSEDA